MRVTLKDVARVAGVSTATVSHVLNGTKTVAEGTRERVEAAVEALGYRLSQPARTLRTGRHRVLGLLLPDLTNPFFPSLAQAVAETARQLGYGLMLSESGADCHSESQALAALEQRVDGVVWIPEAPHPAHRPHRPAVIIDRVGPELAAFDSVSSDHRAGGRLQARLALELGHRRIGLLAGPADSISACSRREALCEALGEIRPEWILEVPFSMELPPETVERLADTRVTLVIAANDAVAIGALKALKAHGRRVPQDVSLIGFDDIPWAAIVEPPLSTVRQPVRAIGRRAVELLHRRLAGQGGEPTHLVLPVEYVERGSVIALEQEAAAI
jgi:LacI family transcriptional regulator